MKAFVFFVIPLFGCAGEGEKRATFAVPLTADAPDEVVATVDGRPIRAGDVARQARAKGCSPKEALEDLVTAEALVSEAARRGLQENREVADAARGEAVRRLLAVTFEKDVTPAAIPQPRSRTSTTMVPSPPDVSYRLASSIGSGPPASKALSMSSARAYWVFWYPDAR